MSVVGGGAEVWGLPGLALTCALARGPKGPSAPYQNRVTVIGVGWRYTLATMAKCAKFGLMPCVVRQLPAQVDRDERCRPSEYDEPSKLTRLRCWRTNRS
jgi:hypothetical protein